MKNLILIGAGAWALEVWSWVKYANGYGTEFTFKGFLSNNLNEIDDKEYCNGRIIDVIDEYEPKVNDVFVCVIGNVTSKRRITLNFENKLFIMHWISSINCLKPTKILHQKTIYQG